MQIPQTTYSEFPAGATVGQVSENGPKSIESRFASGFVTVGTFVNFGPAADQCQAIPAAGSPGNLGVAVFEPARSPYNTSISNDAGAGSYAAGDDVGVLRKGKIWVWSENAVTAGDSVYVRTTASGTSVTGQVRDGALTNFTQHPTAVFMRTTTAAGLALVEVK